MECFEQRNDMIWEIFKRITLATMLRTDHKGQGRKRGYNYEAIEIFQAGDDGGLYEGSSDGGSWRVVGFWICFQDKVDKVGEWIRCECQRKSTVKYDCKVLAWAIRRMELLFAELNKTMASFGGENVKSLVLDMSSLRYLLDIQVEMQSIGLV